VVGEDRDRRFGRIAMWTVLVVAPVAALAGAVVLVLGHH
jgi:hypothetical protein